MMPLHGTAASDAWACKTEELATWLIGPGRLTGDAVAVTSGFAQRLTAMGVPLHRLRIGMRVDNPLLNAWGIVWEPETAAEIFTIPHAYLDTSTY
jgi:adenylate cyclase